MRYPYWQPCGVLRIPGPLTLQQLEACAALWQAVQERAAAVAEFHSDFDVEERE